MALIKISLGDSVLSESAKAPGYKVAKVGGAQALVINSAHKAAVGKCITNARKAKKLATSALKDRISLISLTTKVKKEENPTRKAKLRDQIKSLKARSSANAKEAKSLLREGKAAMRAAGLSSLSSPLKATDISLADTPGRYLRTVTAAQVDSLVVTGRKGYIKPKFLAASKFEALGQKVSTAKPKGSGPRAAVKRVQNAKKSKAQQGMNESPLDKVPEKALRGPRASGKKSDGAQLSAKRLGK
ncbi:hypothetical protein HOT49_gp198 [Erwinia phage vB_EamM_Alexandra]|uniref:Uncharacterized protein n=1 Tax=Erwinia phage vB_EamM_Alexandra TaxID=2201424 RepID=A0A2Z4QDX2_9CAUD|nr:hypothetical protein HOT49_gp198 [Erwinia phage vB_EamM_Alexandra]AWY08465.1 hypothetical protein Alexandra_200 [Erwinia phage vB_EamM_Alexandra]